jgi:hypothetical protein
MPKGGNVTPKQRAKKIHKIIKHHYDPRDHETSLVDLVADAMHFAVRNQISMDDVRSRAMVHYEAEVNGEY